MDAGDLAIFETVARLGGMNRAALELNTVQSNVTARIRLLEEELGTALFRRHSRGVALTQAGHRLLPYSSKIGHLLAEARKAVRDDGTPKGSLTIGSLETTAALRLSSHLAAYVSDYPDVDLVLRTGTTAELVRDVLEYRLEGAFVCGPVDHADLDQRLAFREELAILTAPTVRTLDELFANRQCRIVVLRAGCSYRQRLEDILARRGIINLRLLEFGTIEAILGCVAAGLGVTLLPRSLIGSVTRDHRIIVHELPMADATVDTIFIRRRDSFVSSALSVFLDRACLPMSRAEAAEYALALSIISLGSEPLARWHLTPRLAVGIAYLAIAGTVIAWLLWVHVLKNVPAGAASAFIFSVPLIGVVMSQVVLNEIITFEFAVGAVLICAGITIVNRRGKSAPTDPARLLGRKRVAR